MWERVVEREKVLEEGMGKYGERCGSVRKCGVSVGVKENVG